jgi:hypothetical protein
MRRAPTATRVLGLWLIVWLIAAVFDVALPMKFWKHYFNALLPPLSIIMALTVVLIARQLADRWIVPILTTGVVVVALPAILLVVKHAADSRSIDRPNVPRMVADEIKRVGTNGHDVYIFNYDPLVYSYADTAPPTRFVLGIELADFDVSSGARSIQEIGTALGRRPEWIVVSDPSPYAFSPSALKLLETRLLDYQLDRCWGENDYIQPPIEVRLYHRTDRAQQHEPSLTGISSSVRPSISPAQVRAPVN